MSTAFDLENERALVIAALNDPSARQTLTSAVEPEDFRGERFAIIIQAVAECQQKGLEPDDEAIAVHCGEEDFGGFDFLRKLRSLEAPKNLEFHIARLKQDSARYQVGKSELPELEKMLSDRTIDINECLTKVATIQGRLRLGSADSDTSEVWQEDFDRRCSGERGFQSIGYGVLDELLIDGYSKKGVSVVAGRTGHGKTTFMVDTIRRLVARRVKPKIGVLPLEIGRVAFLDKLISSVSQFPLEGIRKGAVKLSIEERGIFRQMANKLVGSDDRLTVLDNPFLTQTERTNDASLTKIEEMLAIGGYDIVFFDLFQRCLSDLRPASIESSLVRVQHLAKLYNVHLVLLHQISRKAEEKKDKRPALEDLKGSGGYEEIPDLVLLLHRPKAAKQFRRKDEIEIRVAKQRDGLSGFTVIGDFKGGVNRIENEHLPASGGGDDDDE
jgi:replicative DNA helicase